MEYDAFISYRRSDGGTAARWLRRVLERFKAPRRLTRHRDRKLKVYLDTAYERGTSDFYLGTIQPALLASRYLIVIATPNAVRRPEGTEDWILREIEDFSKGPHAGNVLLARAAGAAGDPLPGDLKERFPHIEIVDLRSVGRFWFLNPTKAVRISNEKLKLIAPLIDLAPGEMPILRQEEERAQQIRLGLTAGISLAVVIAVAGLSVYALQSRWRAQQALDSSLFAVSRMVGSLADGLDRESGGEMRSFLLSQACDLIDKLGREAVRNPRPEALVTCMLERGLGREAQGEKAEAERLINGSIALAEQSLANKPTQPVALAAADAYAALADLYYARGDQELHRQTLERLIERASDLGAQLQAGELFRRAAVAEATISALLQRDNDEANAVGKAALAEQYFARSQDLKTDNTDSEIPELRGEILVAIGNMYGRLSKPGEAVEAYRRAIDIGRQLIADGTATPGGRLKTAEAMAALAEMSDRGTHDFTILVDDLRNEIDSLAELVGDMDGDGVARIDALQERFDGLAASPDAQTTSSKEAQ